MAALTETLDEVFAALERRELEPDPSRDWSQALTQLAALRGRLEAAMSAVEEAVAAAAGEAQVDRDLRRWCADVAGMLAAACLAAGKRDPALRLLTRAEKLAVDGAQRDGFTGALSDLEAFRRMVHEAWRARAGERPPRPAAPPPRQPQSPPVQPRVTVRTSSGAPRPTPNPPPQLPPGWNRRPWWASPWRLLAILSLLTLPIWLTTQTCSNSSDRRFDRQLAEARAYERQVPPERALRRYERLLDDFADQDVDLPTVGEAVVRLLADRVPKPLTLAEVDRAVRVADRFDQLAAPARGRVSDDALAERILAWVTDLGDADVERLAAAHRLIVRIRLPLSEPLAARARERRVLVTRQLADRLAADEPQRAFAILVDLDIDGVEEAGRILDGMSGEPSLLRELEPVVRRWLAVAQPLPATSARAAALLGKLDAARAQAADPVREALIAGGDEAALRAALERSPRDQEIASALAVAVASGGDPAAAMQVIEALGPPGRLTAHTRLLLAHLVADAGDLARSDAMLTSYLATLPGRDRAAGPPPAASGPVDTSAAAEIDARLQLASLKLRRAAPVRDPERRAFLEQAETLFMALRAAGGAQGQEHLGLGEVYYRLGRPADGDRELQAALSGGDVRDALAVADVYRALDRSDKARAVLLPRLQAKSITREEREEIALVLSYATADEEERERWLRQAGDAAQTRADLAVLQGNKLGRQGDWAGADRKYSEAAAALEAEPLDDVVANSLALVLEKRTEARGDTAFLLRAIELLEKVIQANPHVAIAVGNLAMMRWHLAARTTLEPWVDLRGTPMFKDDIFSVLKGLALGRLREEISARLRKDVNASRAIELYRRVQILSPLAAFAFSDEADIYQLRGDVAGQRGLLERLSTVSFDEPAGGGGGRDGAGAAGGAKTSEAELKTPSETGSPRAQGAAWELYGDRLREDGRDEAAIEAYERAHELWPDLDAARRGAWLRVTGAVRAAAEAERAFGEDWKREDDGNNLAVALLRCLEGPKGSVARAALLGQPGFREGAADWLAASPTPDLGDYAVAVALADAAQVERAAAVFRDEGQLLNLRIRAALSPSDKMLTRERDRLATGLTAPGAASSPPGARPRP